MSRAAKQQEALAAFRSETLTAFAGFQTAVDDELDYNKASGDDFSQQASNAASSARFWTWTILLLAAASGSLLAFFVIRGINGLLRQSVSELATGAEELASAASQVSSSSG